MVQEKIDKWGTVASLGCAIHCACMPLILGVAPALGLSFFASERFEWILFLLSALLGSASIALGHKKHRRKITFLVMLIGVSLLLYGRVLHETSFHTLGVVSLVAGGMIVASAHMMNHHLCRCHKTRQ